MKKKLLVFLLTICILISFVACGKIKEPIITEASESSSATYTAGDETTSATETTQTETSAAPVIFPGFANIEFASMRDMIEILKKGEVDFKDYADFADDTWLEIDFDRFYELENVPEDYHELGVGWIGKNNYRIVYVKNVDRIDDDTPVILYRQLSTEDMLLSSMKSVYAKTEEQILEEYPSARVTEDETEYGVLKTYKLDENRYYKRMDVYDENGELLWIYFVKRIIPKTAARSYIFNFEGDVFFELTDDGGYFPLETLLSMKPVKVEVDG